MIHLIAYTDFRNSTRTRQKFQSTGLVRSNKSEDAKKKKKKKPDWYLPKIGGKYDEGILAFKSYGEACKTSPIIKPL